jgi:hypothetical protein
MASYQPLTRDEILGGLPARQAQTLLFLIESRTAHRAAKSRESLEVFTSEEAAAERDLMFLEAFSLGREPPLRPTIQDLESFAAQWAPLVPENPRVRAALAHLLGRKYTFMYRSVPRIRAALGLDDERVQQAYERLYHQPLTTVFAALAYGPRERLSWMAAALSGWLDALPPFWMAFILIFTLSFSQAFLGLPVALAGVGALPGLLFLLGLGAINLLTMACMAEAATRSGMVQYRRGFIGRLVSDTLGSTGASLLTAAVIVRFCLSLLAAYIGLAITLASFTRLPSAVWAAVIFAFVLYALSRSSFSFAANLVVLLGGINVSLILALSLLALPHVRPEYLTHVDLPFLAGHPGDAGVLQPVFGLILSIYFGQVYVSQSALKVLPRDPGGRSLLWGSIAATLCMMVLGCLWVLAVNGAVPPGTLAGQAGTALVPLAARLGPIGTVLGSILIILQLGMSSVRNSAVLFHLVRDHLPQQRRIVLVLPRQQGRLLFRGAPPRSVRRPRGARWPWRAGRSIRVALTYLGRRAGRPWFRVDVLEGERSHSMETPIGSSGSLTQLAGQVLGFNPRGLDDALEVLEADDERVRLQVESLALPRYEGRWEAAGVGMVDLLTLEDSLRGFLTWLTRRGGATATEVAAHTGEDEDDARIMLEDLTREGALRQVQVNGQAQYRTRLAPKQGKAVSDPVWQALSEPGTADRAGGSWVASSGAAPRAPGAPPSETTAPAGGPEVSRRQPAERSLSRGERSRFWLAVSPVAAVFLVAERLLLLGQASYNRPLSIAGVLLVSLLAGILPVLLLLSSRRKGDLVPTRIFPFLGHPLVSGSLYLLFLGIVLAHGLLIWQRPLERASALLVTGLAVAATVAIARRGGFATRAVIELRKDAGASDRAQFAVTIAGRPAPAAVRLRYDQREQDLEAATGEVAAFSGLRSARFHLSAPGAEEVRVWAHQITPEGEWEALPAQLEVRSGPHVTRADLPLTGGQAVSPLLGGECRAEVTIKA